MRVSRTASLFIHLKLSAFNNFAAGVFELENINTAKEIREIEDILRVGQVKFCYFFAQKIKDLDIIVFIVLPEKVFKRDIGTGRIGVKSHGSGGSDIRKASHPALGFNPCRAYKHHK